MQHIIKVTTYTMQVVLDGWGQFHVNYVPACTQKNDFGPFCIRHYEL